MIKRNLKINNHSVFKKQHLNLRTLLSLCEGSIVSFGTSLLFFQNVSEVIADAWTRILNCLLLVHKLGGYDFDLISLLEWDEWQLIIIGSFNITFYMCHQIRVVIGISLWHVTHICWFWPISNSINSVVTTIKWL